MLDHTIPVQAARCDFVFAKILPRYKNVMDNGGVDILESLLQVSIAHQLYTRRVPTECLPIHGKTENERARMER